MVHKVFNARTMNKYPHITIKDLQLYDCLVLRKYMLNPSDGKVKTTNKYREFIWKWKFTSENTIELTILTFVRDNKSFTENDELYIDANKVHLNDAKTRRTLVEFDFDRLVRLINDTIEDLLYPSNVTIVYAMELLAHDKMKKKWVTLAKARYLSEETVKNMAFGTTTLKSCGMAKKLTKKHKSTGKSSTVKRMTGNIEALGKNFNKLI